MNGREMRYLACKLYSCSNCEKTSSDDAWQEALWRERSRRISQVARGEVDAVEEGWIDPDNPQSRYTSSYGLDDSMVCPRCKFIHTDDDSSAVEEISGLAIPRGASDDQIVTVLRVALSG